MEEIHIYGQVIVIEEIHIYGQVIVIEEIRIYGQVIILSKITGPYICSPCDARAPSISRHITRNKTKSIVIMKKQFLSMIKMLVIFTEIIPFL